ncbi:nicotinate-nicotinamide nucleotide adenylyltransferase [Psychrobacter sp. ANT_WB68]|uniref:nicotinate-nicotinamide nucleotide adenylyltransferase n=1 Tax=Psychrobacter sp. ANT_WB68 TaxID=2597355 RepID=UPI0011F14ABB|nr:nicotinate-nicotinamide nucleotide adenylyltransferase [Psychrobacter sp. ANT_WB68]KAA0913617.1 nicotinate-nicotinamide nucleotide adenylyltransferase [Psychrobacter sp. ANT_WB68]
MPNTVNHHSVTHTAPAIRAYLGGSFDPVHSGHLQLAIYVYQSLLPLAKQQQRELQVSLLPNARSPFKEDSTHPEHRLAMLRLATQETPLQINELELWQAPPVYTIDSVQILRARYPNDSLIFIMGMDSARSLDKWKDGLSLTDYVNLWVFNREENPDIHKRFSETDLLIQLKSQLPVPLQPLVTVSATELVIPPFRHLTDSPILKNAYQGRIYIDPRPVAAISSTQVRQYLHQSHSRTPHSLHIKHAAETQIAFLQPINAIISNTAPNSFAKWLNPAVYQYIIAHQLYSAAQFR